MEFSQWIRLFEVNRQKKLDATELAAIEALEPALQDDPTYVALAALNSGEPAHQVSQRLHRAVRGSCIAVLRLLIEDGYAVYQGRGKLGITAAGKAFLEKSR